MTEDEQFKEDVVPETATAVTVTESEIKFTANQITLEGYVTANKNFKIDTNGNMEANGGTIGGWTISDKGITSPLENISLGWAAEALGGSSGTNTKYTYGTLYNYYINTTNGKKTSTLLFGMDNNGVQLNSQYVKLTDLNNSALRERLYVSYKTDSTAASDNNVYTKLLNIYNDYPPNGIFAFLSNPAHSVSIGLTNNNWMIQLIKYSANTGIFLAFPIMSNEVPARRCVVWNGKIDGTNQKWYLMK